MNILLGLTSEHHERREHKACFPVSTLFELFFFLEQKALVFHHDTGARDLGALRALRAVLGVEGRFSVYAAVAQDSLSTALLPHSQSIRPGCMIAVLHPEINSFLV